MPAASGSDSSARPSDKMVFCPLVSSQVRGRGVQPEWVALRITCTTKYPRQNPFHHRASCELNEVFGLSETEFFSVDRNMANVMITPRTVCMHSILVPSGRASAGSRHAKPSPVRICIHPNCRFSFLLIIVPNASPQLSSTNVNLTEGEALQPQDG